MAPRGVSRDLSFADETKRSESHPFAAPLAARAAYSRMRPVRFRKVAMSTTNRVAGLFAVVALFAGAGCAGGVDRTVVVKSEPPGALVYMNGQEVGRTPAEVPILWYGTYDLRLRQDG